MPYNNTPITPSTEITGTCALPLARVKKIIHADEDIGPCSNNAAFAITIATEMFLQHLVEQSYNIVKSERKPRRNIQYRDVANAVARVENLEFLCDVVPKPLTYNQYKQRLAEKAASGKIKSNGLAKGQETLDGHMGESAKKGDEQETNGASHEAMDIDEEEDDIDEDDDRMDQVHESEHDEDPDATKSPEEQADNEESKEYIIEGKS